jgi:hypothetical protein
MDLEFFEFLLPLYVAISLFLMGMATVIAIEWVATRPMMTCIEARGSWVDGACVFNREEE